MRYIRPIMAILAMLMLALTAFAQDEIEFEPFASEQFGIEGLRPAGWDEASPGVFAEDLSTAGGSAIITQSAPFTIEQLQSVLAGQFQIDAFPDATGEVETDFATWTLYRIDNDDFGLSLTVALTNVEDVSYLLIGQSPVEGHEEFVESVFNPVLDSIRALEPVEEPVADDLPYTEEDVTFANGETTLAGTLTIPLEGDAFPVVVIVSGSGGQNRSGSVAPLAEVEMYTQLADYLARQGIAVLRYDDRGVGDSTTDTLDPSLLDFRDDANAAVDFLATRDEFTHTGIVGHSEGGVYAPEISLTNDNVDFLIMLNAPAVSLVEVSIYQQRAFGEAAGLPDEILDGIETAYRDVLAILNEGDDDALRDAITALVEAQTGQEASENVVTPAVRQFQSAIFQDYVSYDPLPFLTEVDVPALAVFGSLDLQVVVDQNVPPLEGLNDNVEIVVIDDMNHIFLEAETGLLGEYGTLEQVVMPELLETLVEWILETTAG